MEHNYLVYRHLEQVEKYILNWITPLSSKHSMPLIVGYYKCYKYSFFCLPCSSPFLFAILIGDTVPLTIWMETVSNIYVYE